MSDLAVRQPLLAEDVWGVCVGAFAVGLFGGCLFSVWPVIGVYALLAWWHLLPPFQDSETWLVFVVSVGLWPAGALVWMLWDRFGWRRNNVG